MIGLIPHLFSKNNIRYEIAIILQNKPNNHCFIAGICKLAASVKQKTMKSTFYYILLILIGFVSITKSQTTKVKEKYLPGKYADLEYDKVIAYDYNGNRGEYIVVSGKLNDTLIKKQIVLTKQQIDTLQSILFNTKTYGALSGKTAFRPHLGIVYYFKNKIVAHISISLETNWQISNLKIPAMYQEKIKEPLYNNQYCAAEGFSKTGRQKIKKFCNDLNFSCYKDALNSIYDK